MSGRVLVFAICCVIPLALTYSAAGHETVRNQIALSAGVVAFSMMAVNLFLATRPALIEPMVGGLDRVYELHKWIGISVIVLILIHTQLRFVQLEGVVAPGSLAETSVKVAEPAFYAMLILLLVSAVKRLPRLPYEIPYHIWRQSHRLVGVVFLALVFHQYFVKAPFTAADPVGWWLNMMAIIGVGSFLYTQFGAVLRRRGYRVTSVKKHVAATIVEAEPLGRGLSTRPGNFAFLSARRNGLREPHPFTVSGILPDGKVQFSIRGLGDYTRRLRDLLQEGDKLLLEGGYGQFSYLRGGELQVWVAGGIGVTPFLAMADDLSPDEARQIVMVYCVRNRADAVGIERLEAAAARSANFTLHLFESDTAGRFDATALLALVPFEMGKADLFFCGPGPMRTALLDQLKAAGKTPAHVYFERFEFR